MPFLVVHARQAEQAISIFEENDRAQAIDGQQRHCADQHVHDLFGRALKVEAFRAAADFLCVLSAPAELPTPRLGGSRSVLDDTAR